MHYHDLPYLLILQWIRRRCRESKKWRAHSRIRKPPCADWMASLLCWRLRARARSVGRSTRLFWLTRLACLWWRFWFNPVTRIFLISSPKRFVLWVLTWRLWFLTISESFESVYKTIQYRLVRSVVLFSRSHSRFVLDELFFHRTLHFSYINIRLYKHLNR